MVNVTRMLREKSQSYLQMDFREQGSPMVIRFLAVTSVLYGSFITLISTHLHRATNSTYCTMT